MDTMKKLMKILFCSKTITTHHTKRYCQQDKFLQLYNATKKSGNSDAATASINSTAVLLQLPEHSESTISDV